MEKINELRSIQNLISLMINDFESRNSRTNNKVERFDREKADLITCKEAAKLYPIGEQKFRELCRTKNKNFPSIKIGCRYYIVKEKLDEWFMGNAIGGCF